MAGILSKGIKLAYATGTGSATTWNNIANLQEVPDLGAAPEQVDVTCLADGNMKYINGLVDFGALEFTFLYDNSESTSNFRVLKGLEAAGNSVDWQLEFPDGTKFQFSGQPSVRINGASVNAALQFVLSISLNSDFTVVNPL